MNSSKREQPRESVIGNFGTGFLTTHLLSKRVYLSGAYVTQKRRIVRFENLVLDRAGRETQIKENLMHFD